tara:strand:+ start:957 stop:1100 length:144 start_codon:yes stop_codon:yes gene_type:complete
MSKTYTVDITTRHIVEAETAYEAISKSNNTNISEFIGAKVISIEDEE